MSELKYIKNVALVGAGGHIGGHFLQELLKTKKHNVTILTRPESTTTNLPAEAHQVKVAYNDHEGLVKALRGQDFFIITLSVTAAPDTHENLVKAAAEAGVPYIMPNAYGADVMDQGFREDKLYGEKTWEKCLEVQRSGVSSVIMVCGFWYEWSLATGEPWYGFDIKNRRATFIDGGSTKITTSTWQLCGRALAALLSLPESGASPSVSDWKNKPFYIGSFTVNQRDMLDSLHRVLGTTDADWAITHEEAEKRYQDGLSELAAGTMTGFAKAMYTRGFTPAAHGNFEERRGLDLGKIGVEKDDLDEATRRAVAMVEEGWVPFAGGIPKATLYASKE